MANKISGTGKITLSFHDPNIEDEVIEVGKLGGSTVELRMNLKLPTGGQVDVCGIVTLDV